ncbi:Na(+)-translocating NADH-quinone reductase subunit A [bacterium]|nr:Na(+)-translocating NADH-quinone reductase subunit A [candidate division CSSED10-310 bacterium]
MAVYTVRRGKDLKIAGAPSPQELKVDDPPVLGVKPVDFLGIKPKLLIRENDRVVTGQPLFYAKGHEKLMFCSPGCGIVTAIRRGARRVITEIEVTRSGAEDSETFRVFRESELANISVEELSAHLMHGGMWPYIRQRPFGKIANPSISPAVIFINGMDTEPLAADPCILMDGREEDFRMGVRVLQEFTHGPIYLTLPLKTTGDPPFAQVAGVTVHHFTGPHPSGLVGTHIRHIRPLKPAEIAWTLRAVHVADIGSFIRTGKYPVHRTVAISGTGVAETGYVHTRLGVPVSALIEHRVKDEWVRYISGTVLTGSQVEKTGYLGFYDNTLTVIPESEKRDFMGWAMPGWRKYSLLKAYASCVNPSKTYHLDTRINGGVRAIVNIGAWERVFALDVHISYLIRAILAEDLEEACDLGLLEVTEEDVALCTFACPSKMELGEIIRKGLDLYEKENL